MIYKIIATIRKPVVLTLANDKGKNGFRLSIAFMMWFANFPLLAQAPIIQAVTPASGQVGLYGKFEAKIDVSANFQNPYDYDAIRVAATFTAPDGRQTTVEGFYMEGFEVINASTGALGPVSARNGFHVRFAPNQTGRWSYVVTCTNASGTGTFPVQTFECAPASGTQNKGFIRAGKGNYWVYNNGEQYIPVGENIAWPVSNPYLDYRQWVSRLVDNGGNFFRLWLCHWGLGMEWKNNVNGFSGLKRYKQSSAFYLDWLFDYCAERGVGIMLCLNHHGQVSSQVNPNWAESPYNAANGGPCQNTWDFFSNATAKQLHKNRLRYAVARWGYARSLATWELFNEINWTDQYEQRKPVIADWHAEMAAFLKKNDPVGRPVGTSYGNPESEDPTVWNNPDVDYTQRHYYVDNPNLEAILAAGARENLERYEKPVLIGEFGLGLSGETLLPLDPKGIHIHNSMWAGLFGGGLGTGMSWWWDSYLHPQNLYTHFKGPAALAQQVALERKNFQPTNASVSGAAGDLKLGTALDWGALGDSVVRISADGSMTPAAPRLGQFLYGAQWNTQFRRPPTFRVEMPQAGQFKVLAGNAFGTNPRLVIWLDGVQVLSVAPTPNQTYSINVPSGQHVVKVDNTGTDWMRIACYAFTNLGSAVDAYALRSADGGRFCAWVLNSAYNHASVKSNGIPSAVKGAMLHAQGMANGTYSAKWFDCLTGALLTSSQISVSGGQLSVPLPDLVWDATLVVEDVLLDASAAVVPAMPLSVSPNPVRDTPVQLRFNLKESSPVSVSLLGPAGAVVQTLFTGPLEEGEQLLDIPMPTYLPAGVYWIEIATTKARGVTPLVRGE